MGLCIIWRGIDFVGDRSCCYVSNRSGVGEAAIIGKSHSERKDDLVLQYVINNSLREHPVLTKLRLVTREPATPHKHLVSNVILLSLTLLQPTATSLRHLYLRMGTHRPSLMYILKPPAGS